MAEYGSQEVLCPFYRSETKKTINCEGTVDKICFQSFRSQKKKKLFKEEYCCRFNYKNCPYCKLLEQKYK